MNSFPPSRTTSLCNEISNFKQKFGESFHEAWDKYKDLLRACPHHGFTELHQLNTFYNALNHTDQDSLNAAASGNLLERSTQDVLTIIENKSIASQVKACDTNSSFEIAKLTHAVNEQTSAVTTTMTAMLKQFQATPPPALVKAVEENIQEYGSAAATNYNQGNLSYRPQGVANQIRPPEDGVTRLKKYSELSSAKATQADCDVKATNIILHALPLEIYALQERECKLYDAFDKFAYQKGETLRDFHLKFSLLFNEMNMYNMKLEQFQVNTKFLNTLPPKWSKFVTDVKLVRDLHTTNIDQLHAYLGQHEYHANEVRLMRERHSDRLALISQHRLNRPTYQHHQQSYHQP
nr:reverse transcriptase domain-containing protein [Tanacetum cinerariifolium]